MIFLFISVLWHNNRLIVIQKSTDFTLTFVFIQNRMSNKLPPSDPHLLVNHQNKFQKIIGLL